MPWYCLALSWGLTLPSCPGFGFLIRNLSIVYFPPLSSKHGNQLTVKWSCLSSWDIYCHQSPNWFRALWSANDCQGYKQPIRTNCHGGPHEESENERMVRLWHCFWSYFLFFSSQKGKICEIMHKHHIVRFALRSHQRIFPQALTYVHTDVRTYVHTYVRTYICTYIIRTRQKSECFF